MARRHYSDEERAAALAALKANGGNILRTSQQAGVPQQTLRQWRDNPDHAAPPQVREQKTRDLSAKLDEIVHALADAIPGKIPDASMKDCATSMGIAIDKQRLIDGEPTERVEITDLTDEQRAERLRGLAERIRQRRLSTADAG